MAKGDWRREPQRVAPGLPRRLARHTGRRSQFDSQCAQSRHYRVRRLMSYACNPIRVFRSIDLRIEEFLRTRRVHVSLGDDIDTGIEAGRHFLALRSGERGLDTIIAHAERV